MKLRIDENKVRIRLSSAEYEKLLEMKKIQSYFKITPTIRLEYVLCVTFENENIFTNYQNKIDIKLNRLTLESLHNSTVEGLSIISKEYSSFLIFLELDKKRHATCQQ